MYLSSCSSYEISVAYEQLISQLHCYNVFFFNDTATPEIYTLSLHDALPIYLCPRRWHPWGSRKRGAARRSAPPRRGSARGGRDRKSTRLNSSHVEISYAVFCLKKKKKKHRRA